MRRIISVLFLIGLLNFTSVAQSDFSFSFDHTALSVTDLEMSSKFYMEVLGLKEITNRTQNPGIRWFSLGEGKELHLISIVKENVVINKAIHFALRTPAFEVFVSNLKDKQYPFIDWMGIPGKISTRPDGVKQVFLRDPDGYYIEINSVE